MTKVHAQANATRTAVETVALIHTWRRALMNARVMIGMVQASLQRPRQMACNGALFNFEMQAQRRHAGLEP